MFHSLFCYISLSKWDTSIKLLPGRELCAQGVIRILRARGVGDTKETDSSRHLRTSAHMTSHGLWQHAQVQARWCHWTEMLKWTLVSIPNDRTKKLSPIGNRLQRKINCLFFFPTKSHGVYKLHVSAGPRSSSREPTQSKFNGIFRDFFPDITLGMF